MLLRVLVICLLAASSVTAQENQLQEAEMMRDLWTKTPKPYITITQPVYSRIISLDLPRPFVPAYRQEAATGYIGEYVPDGETLANWTQMITITSSNGIGSVAMDDATLARYIFGRVGCSGKLYEDFGTVPSGSSARQRVLVAGCDGPTGGERTAIAFLRDAEHLWTVQFAQRVSAGKGAALLAPDKAKARLESLNIRAFTLEDAKAQTKEGKPQ